MFERKKGFRRISDEAVRRETGKSWKERYKILDAWGPKEEDHSLHSEASQRAVRAESSVGSGCGHSLLIGERIEEVESNLLISEWQGRLSRIKDISLVQCLSFLCLGW